MVAEPVEFQSKHHLLKSTKDVAVSSTGIVKYTVTHAHGEDNHASHKTPENHGHASHKTPESHGHVSHKVSENAAGHGHASHKTPDNHHPISADTHASNKHGAHSKVSQKH